MLEAKPLEYGGKMADDFVPGAEILDSKDEKQEEKDGIKKLWR